MIECRAVIELIATAEKAVFEEMARVNVHNFHVVHLLIIF